MNAHFLAFPLFAVLLESVAPLNRSAVIDKGVVMTNAVSTREQPAEVEGVRALRVAGDQESRIAEFRAKVRAVGEQWVDSRPAGLTELLCAAAADDPELARLARVGGQLIEDFVEGFSHNTTAGSSTDLAADLIDGRMVPRDTLKRLAATYVVVLTRPAPQWRAGRVLELAGRGVLCSRKSGALVVLVPDGHRDLERIIEHLAGENVVAMASGPVARLADAYAEACEVLRLAGCRPAGAYTMTDVLIEHAISTNDSVVTRLAELVRPLRENQMLWQTLVTLIHADFNRNQVARELFIHRTTVDYRIQRIAKLTGCDPANGRGALLLSAALTANAME